MIKRGVYKMKMIIAIVQDQDSQELSDQLVKTISELQS